MIYLILIQLINIFFHGRHVKFQLHLPHYFSWFSSNEASKMQDAISKNGVPKNSGCDVKKRCPKKTLDAMSKNGVPKNSGCDVKKRCPQKTLDAMSKNGVPKKLWIMVVNIELYSVAG